MCARTACGSRLLTSGIVRRFPRRRLLLPIRPNPATGLARIAFDLPGASRVRLRIYDTAGRLMNQLADGPMVGGRHDIAWDGRDALGRHVSSGVCFCELEVNGVKEARRMVQRQ